MIENAVQNTPMDVASVSGTSFTVMPLCFARRWGARTRRPRSYGRRLPAAALSDGTRRTPVAAPRAGSGGGFMRNYTVLIRMWRHATVWPKNLCWFQVMETRGNIDKGKVHHWQVTIKVGFTVAD
jgi:hypothetical protein